MQNFPSANAETGAEGRRQGGAGRCCPSPGAVKRPGIKNPLTCPIMIDRIKGNIIILATCALPPPAFLLAFGFVLALGAGCTCWETLASAFGVRGVLGVLGLLILT